GEFAVAAQPPDSFTLEPLGPRESDILSCLAEGLSNRDIADRLYLAPSTVKWYVRQLNSKFDTTNREEIVARARQFGLLDQPAAAPKRLTLPHQTTPFVGRDVELDAVHDLLAESNIRLVTILATGGMGKTRLALEAAEQQQRNFPDGVYFVPLQPLSEV